MGELSLPARLRFEHIVADDNSYSLAAALGAGADGTSPREAAARGEWKAV